MTNLVAQDPLWLKLRRHTPARIGLARAGAHIASDDQLAFQLAHAQARDAVHALFEPAVIAAALEERGLAALTLRSAASDRGVYLARPDLGRRLDLASRGVLTLQRAACDIAFVIADGLSATAVHRHALPVLDGVIPTLSDLRIGPVAVVERGRVAIGDEIGEILGADLVIVLLGERPGLSSPDSLGVYITWGPRIGRKDAERNCVSNIRPEGLSYADAAGKLVFLIAEARRRQVTGVMLKDETASAEVLSPTGQIKRLP
jgi:ethanolamine ammonia-lyase small subunit